MTNSRTRAGWLREPLLHFLLIGAALFLLHRVLNGGETGAPREIVVTEQRVEALAENFARTWMRPPTAEEIKGLVDDFVAEEVYYREAIAMGLDADDVVIRRRLRQKMEFISEDVAAAVAPTDAQLEAYLAKHAEKFLEPPRRRHVGRARTAGAHHRSLAVTRYRIRLECDDRRLDSADGFTAVALSIRTMDGHSRDQRSAHSVS